MSSYGSQEAKVYPSGRETKFFFVPSCMVVGVRGSKTRTIQTIKGNNKNQTEVGVGVVFGTQWCLVCLLLSLDFQKGEE